MSTKAKIKKAASKAKKAAGDLETKEIMNIALIAGVGIGLFSLAKTFGLVGNKKKKEEKQKGEEAIRASGEIDKLKRQGSKPTYSNSQYTNLANALKEALDCPTYRCWDGTEEEEVYRVFKSLKKDIDFLMLQEAYQKRGGNIFVGGKGMVEDLVSDLNTKQKNEVNKILKDQGIKYFI